MSIDACASLSDRRAMQVAAEFVAAGHSVESAGDLDALLGAAAGALGFGFHALVQHGRPARAPEPQLALLDYPASWQERFDAEGLYRFDPVQCACRSQLVGFAWAEIPAIVRLTPRQQRVLEESRRHGIGDGFTVPIHLPGERAASCSFATRGGASLPQRNLMAAQLLGQFGYEVGRRIGRASAAAHEPLSPRQRECVLLVAQGKSDWEIAQILGLSEETVTKYLNAARARFDVSRRTQLAVVALHEGEIGFEEVLRH
ncbi:autoinducer binding domain-containing protein [Sphingomonas canadensis]|uniref:Autoinducer binding domain-containing protein n=1 Tax=Sphingomonas canadensis TaxID=1219257 RepID=A0ABW3H1R1_9SPHN|nr:LuxR family transcriptional regulator [Sphingomonas canadensis]MCW3835017.1 LuxR family transcriptional regulator [Sphingomonas canadensis]